MKLFKLTTSHMHLLEISTMFQTISRYQYVQSKAHHIQNSSVFTQSRQEILGECKVLSNETFLCVVYLQCLMWFSALSAEWRKRSIALIISSYTWVYSVIELCWALQSLQLSDPSAAPYRDKQDLHLDSIQKTKRHVNIPAVWRWMSVHDSSWNQTPD